MDIANNKTAPITTIALNFKTFSSAMAWVRMYGCNSDPKTLCVVSAPKAFWGKMGVPVKPN